MPDNDENDTPLENRLTFAKVMAVRSWSDIWLKVLEMNYFANLIC